MKVGSSLWMKQKKEKNKIFGSIWWSIECPRNWYAPFKSKRNFAPIPGYLYCGICNICRHKVHQKKLSVVTKEARIKMGRRRVKFSDKSWSGKTETMKKARNYLKMISNNDTDSLIKALRDNREMINSVAKKLNPKLKCSKQHQFLVFFYYLFLIIQKKKRKRERLVRRRWKT